MLPKAWVLSKPVKYIVKLSCRRGMEFCLNCRIKESHGRSISIFPSLGYYPDYD